MTSAQQKSEAVSNDQQQHSDSNALQPQAEADGTIKRAGNRYALARTYRYTHAGTYAHTRAGTHTCTHKKDRHVNTQTSMHMHTHICKGTQTCTHVLNIHTPYRQFRMGRRLGQTWGGKVPDRNAPYSVNTDASTAATSSAPTAATSPRPASAGGAAASAHAASPVGADAAVSGNATVRAPSVQPVCVEGSLLPVNSERRSSAQPALAAVGKNGGQQEQQQEQGGQHQGEEWQQQEQGSDKGPGKRGVDRKGRVVLEEGELE